MKNIKFTIAVTVIFMIAGCATELAPSSISRIDLPNIKQHPYSVGLFVTKELNEYTFKKITSPLDSIMYPLGQQLVLTFQKNLPTVFKNVENVNSLTPTQMVKLVIKPSIVKFDLTIPFPAYNPYVAVVVYKIDVFNQKGENIYSQTTTGEAQTSNGLLSGFSAQGLLAEVAQMAIDKAMQSIVEGLAEAEELKAVN